MKLKTLDEILRARILVAITFHYNPRRLQYLARVMRLLSEFEVETLTVKIFTNTSIVAELETIRRLGLQILPISCVSLEVCQDLRHPFELTWSHKELLATVFEGSAEPEYSHFIYLEDDMGLSFANFKYFCNFRPALAARGLIPSFLRVEYSSLYNGFVNTDIGTPIEFLHYPSVSVEDLVFIGPPNPYCACFIFDHDLAVEHLRSRSSGVDTSASVSDWDIRERAAMGQCFENIPVPFGSRYVVPVRKASNSVPTYAWLSHLANNYADDEASPFGKVLMDRLIV